MNEMTLSIKKTGEALPPPQRKSTDRSIANPIGGYNNPSPELLIFITADRGESSLLEHIQQLDQHRDRDVTKLIDKEDRAFSHQ